MGMNGRTVRVGVIGTGAIAHVAHFPSLASMEDVEICAVLSRDFAKAEAAARRYGATPGAAVRDLAGFLARDPDCAVLLTPKTVRREYLFPLLDAGLDILVEKPLATTLSECSALADAAEKSGRIVMVAFNRRYSPVNQGGIAAFCAAGAGDAAGESARPGPVSPAALVSARPEYVLAQKNREFREYRGTLENAVHMVDMLRYILGEAVKVEAAARWDDPFRESLCTAQIGFECGSVGLLGASRSAGQWFERIEMYGGNRTVIMECPERYRVVLPDREEVRNMTPLNKGWANLIDMIGFRPCIRQFIDCVRSRGTPLTSAQDSFRTHELLDRILRTAGLPDMSRDWGNQP